jgi:hypothetical protein
MAYKLTYLNQNATRNLPLSDQLAALYQQAAEAAGIDEIRVGSGGQPATGKRRTGSHRHDWGGAGDIKLVKDGRVLNFNKKEDLPIISSFVSAARGAGATGIGAGESYMGPETLHVGFGNPAVWGGTKRQPVPEWLRNAYNQAKATAAPGVTLNSVRPAAGEQPPLTANQPVDIDPGVYGAPENLVASTEGFPPAPKSNAAPSDATGNSFLGKLKEAVGGDAFKGVQKAAGSREGDTGALQPTGLGASVAASDAARMQAGQALMATLLAGRKRRGMTLNTPPLSMMG